jgi:hypothetical protein
MHHLFLCVTFLRDPSVWFQHVSSEDCNLSQMQSFVPWAGTRMLEN